MRSAASVQLPADNVVLVSINSLYRSRKRRSPASPSARAFGTKTTNAAAAKITSVVLISSSYVCSNHSGSSRRLESLQHVHGVDADLGHRVSALEHEQRGNSQRADEPAKVREVVGPQLEKADRIVFEGIDAERYHERARREPFDPRQRRFEGRAPRAEIAPSRQRQVLVVPDALPGANLIGIA